MTNLIYMIILKKVEVFKLKEGSTLPKVWLIALVACVAYSVVISQVNAQPTIVSILPSSLTIDQVGQTATVDLNITDVTNLYAYEIKIWYLNSIVKVTQVVRPPGHFLEPIGGENETNKFVAKWEIKNDYNTTHGRIWIAYTLLAPQPAKSGSGILVKITFEGLSVGQTPIILNNYPGVQGPVKLADNTASPIPHQAQDGSITVFPEFPSAMILVTALLLISAYMVKLKRPKPLR